MASAGPCAAPNGDDLGNAAAPQNQTWGGIVPDLAGVPETMLWSLYNRASEASRPDAILIDPESLRIRAAIDYDFAGHFGAPLGSLAVRAAAIDRALREWLLRHPDGMVVSLGEGLETQSRRVDNGRMRWLTVDLEEAIGLREQFLQPTARFRHLAANALAAHWMDAVDASRPVCIVAQGLLMYLAPEAVRMLLCAIAERFPAAEILFDTVPRWFSQATRRGVHQTPRYRLPPMPWGINRDEVEATLRAWHPRMADVKLLEYRMPRGLPLMMANITNALAVARHQVPSLVHVVLAGEAPAATVYLVSDELTEHDLCAPLRPAGLEPATKPL